MRMKTCPRCGDIAYEKFRSFSVCHACQWNSVENYKPKKKGDSDNREPKRTGQRLSVKQNDFRNS